MLALLDQTYPFVANEAEATIARAAHERLKAVAEAGEDVRLIVESDTKIVVPLPARAVMLVVQLLETMAQRIPVSIIPHEAELTTQQAADYLNVSRPYLIGLIDSGKIHHRTVGRHRRVRFGDLLDYEQRSLKEREAALEEMAREAERLGLE